MKNVGKGVTKLNYHAIALGEEGGSIEYNDDKDRRG